MLVRQYFDDASRRTRLLRYRILVALAVMLIFPSLAVAEDDHEPGYSVVSPTTVVITGIAPAAATPFGTTTPISMPSSAIVPTATTMATATPRPPTATVPPPTATATAQLPTATPDPLAGLVMIARGPAAFYGAGYDRGGWEAIIHRHIQYGQVNDNTFAWSPQGYYCVHPDYHLGNILTLQNPRTGKTIQCTVADAVDAGDEALWRSRWKVEMSYAAFTALALNGEANIVTVWVLKD